MTQITIKHHLKKGEQQSTKWCNQQLTQNTSKQGTPSEWESQPPHMRIEPSSKCINQGSICFAPANIPDRQILPQDGETVPRCNRTTQTHRGPCRSNSTAQHRTPADPDFSCIPAACGASFAHCIGKHAQQVPRPRCFTVAWRSGWDGSGGSEFKSMAPKYCNWKDVLFFGEVFGVSHEHWPKVSLSCTRHPLALGQAARWPARWNQKSPWVAFFFVVSLALSELIPNRMENHRRYLKPAISSILLTKRHFFCGLQW